MRVLKVVDALRFGGAESLIVQLARVADHADLEVSVLALQGDRPEHLDMVPSLQDAGVEPHVLGVRRTLDAPAFLRLVKFIKDTKPDVVHAHLEMAMTLALPAAALAGVPAVATFHNMQAPLSGRAGRREQLALEVATRSQATIFVSQSSLDSFAARYRSGKPVPPSWKVVHNGADLDVFTPADSNGAPAMLPPDLGIDGSRVVTVPAGLREYKGLHHTIEAWPGVVAKIPDAKLLLVGSGPEEQNLRARVNELGLTESVVFAGLRNDIPEIMRASDLVLLASIYGENLPTVVIEAGGCARPVVASDVGGVSDIVVDGETGLLVPPADPAAITRALLTVLDDPDLGARLGRAGRERVERLFDARGWARSLRSVYEQAIADKRPSDRSA